MRKIIVDFYVLLLDIILLINPQKTYYHGYILLEMDFSYLKTLPSMQYSSEKSILVKQNNTRIYMENHFPRNYITAV